MMESTKKRHAPGKIIYGDEKFGGGKRGVVSRKKRKTLVVFWLGFVRWRRKKRVRENRRV